MGCLWRDFHVIVISFGGRQENMASFADNKFAVCAGIAGVLGAGVLGYVLGRRNQTISASRYINVKSHYQEGKNPIMEYVLQHSLREPEPLRKLKEETLKYGIKVRMLGAPEESQLFRVLFSLINIKRVIEIGVYTGYNTLNFALSVPDDGKVVACDVTDEYYNAVGKQVIKEAGVENKIDLRIQPATQTLDELIANGEAGTYDFVFIDANKSSYDTYYEKALQLLRKGGLIAVDNVLWDSRVLQDLSAMDSDTRSIHELNLKIHKDGRVKMSMLPFADGVTLAMKI